MTLIERTTLDDTHAALRTRATAWAGPLAAAGAADAAAWASAGAEGFLALALARARDGADGPADLRPAQVVLEALVRTAGSGLGYAEHAAVALPAIERYGSAQFKERWLEAATAGTCRLALAVADPGEAYDITGATLSARPDGEGWILDGASGAVAHGATADAVVLLIPTADGARGLFLAEMNAQGLERRPAYAHGATHAGGASQDFGASQDGGATQDGAVTRDGAATRDCAASRGGAELVFGGVRLGPHAVLAGRDGWERAWEAIRARQRLFVAVAAMAGAQALFDTTLRFVTLQRAGGRPIGANQDVRFAMARMRTELDIAQTFVDEAVFLAGRGAAGAVGAAEAKLLATTLAARVAERCATIRGSLALGPADPATLALSAARAALVEAGSNAAMKELISRATLDDVPGG